MLLTCYVEVKYVSISACATELNEPAFLNGVLNGYSLLFERVLHCRLLDLLLKIVNQVRQVQSKVEWHLNILLKELQALTLAQ